jgi:hypothetical protein
LSAPTLALRGLAAALALGSLLGCASEPRRERVVLLGAGSQVYLILPLNVAAVMPPELESASPILWEELELFLRAHGKQLKTVAPEVARDLWIRSIQQVRGGEKGPRAGYDDAARALALELRNHTEFDAMIAPSLFVREAIISDRSARWDGVEHEVEFEGRSLESRNLPATPLEGAAPAASLHVAVFDAKGEKLHDAKGGLQLLVRVRVAGTDPAGLPKFRFAARSDLFQNREHLREGLAVAFAPLLAPLPK